MQQHEYFMNLALQQAQNALDSNEVPVGAILVDENGKELAIQYNRKEGTFNATAHAEILCIEEASEKLKNWRLAMCTLYVTLEPCVMCLSAIIQARIKLLVFGAYDLKGGSISLGYDLHKDTRLNHRLNVIGGVHHFKCSKLLSDFFKSKRLQTK